jgi:hypothetical protein
MGEEGGEKENGERERPFLNSSPFTPYVRWRTNECSFSVIESSLNQNVRIPNRITEGRTRHDCHATSQPHRRLEAT